MRMIQITLSVLLMSVLIGEIKQPLRAQSQDIDDNLEVIAGMRQRRMFDLAEQLVQQTLSDKELNPTDQVRLQLSWIRTLIAKAVATPLAERDSVWQQLEQKLLEFRTANGDHPRQILMDVQQALTYQTHGNLLVQEIAAEIGGPVEKDQALVQLRNASRQIKQIESEIEQMLPQQRGRRLSEHELSIQQLLNLRRNMKFQEARTNLIKAQLYAPDDRLNRLDTLNLVSNRLEEVLKQSNPDQPLWWQAQIQRMKCFTLLGNNAAAKNVLNELPVKQLPASLAPQLLEQQIDAVVATGKIDNVQTLLNAIQTTDRSSPNLQLSILRLYMLLAKTATDGTAQGQWQKSASQLTQAIETINGPYWGRRAELVLIGPSQGSPSTTNPDSDLGMNSDVATLIRVGDQAVRKNNLDDAIRAYTKANREAQKNGNAEQALLASVRLSQIHESTKDHQSAADVLIAASLNNKPLPMASAAHLRGCWNRAQLAKENPAEADLFVTLLDQNLQTWPESKTANQARLWKAGYYQSKSQWPQAIEVYLQIDSTGSQAVEALGQLAYCYSQFRRKHNGKDVTTKKMGQQIVDRLQTVATPSQATILLLAEVGLSSATLDTAQVIAMLDQFIASAPDTELETKQQAEVWRIVALAMQSTTTAQAKESLTELPNQASLLQLCDKGFRLTETFATLEQQDEIAELKLIVANKALSISQNKNTQSYWQLQQARALQLLGKQDEALTQLRKLAAEQPKSLEIQLRLGRSLTQTASESDETLQQWRRIAAQAKPQSAAWFEAKLQVASTLAAQKQTEQALNLLNYMNAIPPGWKQSSLKSEFDALLRRLKQ